MAAMEVANKELSGTLKTLKIDDIDKMQDEMLDLVGYSSEIQDSLGQSYSVPDDLDEEELMGGKRSFVVYDRLTTMLVKLYQLVGSEKLGIILNDLARAHHHCNSQTY
eukprot:Gb_25924 [translate_table: standard]